MHKFYNLKPILKTNSLFNIIIGPCAIGKTISVLQYSFEQWFKKGSKLLIIKRYNTEFGQRQCNLFFESLNSSGIIQKITKGKWDFIKYLNNSWFAAKWDNELKKYALNEEPFAYNIALNTFTAFLPLEYKKIENVLFDDFITKNNYLDNELNKFMNIIAILNSVSNIKIFMCGNPKDKNCIYFNTIDFSNIKPNKIYVNKNTAIHYISNRLDTKR